MAIMALVGKNSFSENGQYLAWYTEDGKLKVWETGTGTLKQEYTPNFHLASPGTCIKWIKLSLETITPKKKKKLKYLEGNKETDIIAIGTASGSILLYCLASGSVLNTLEGGPTASVNCLTWDRGTNLFSCAGETIVEWVVGTTNVESSWKAGKDITQLLIHPDGKSILSASKNITLWSLPEHQRLKSFSGHASNVSMLVFVPPVSDSSERYFVSGAESDRYLSAWSLSVDSHNTTVAQFLMEDVAQNICICPGSKKGSTTMSVVTLSGVSHLYTLQLNGKSAKPLKPKLTIQISESCTQQNQRKDSVSPIPIWGVYLCSASSILIAHGKPPLLTFEKIQPNYSEKVQILERNDHNRTHLQPKGLATKVVEPEIGVTAQYLNSLVGTSSGSAKRGHKGHCEVPMEERLNNLTLNRSDASAVQVPRGDNVAHLLLQGLQSKDRRLVHTVLLQRDEAVIKRTVARLPVQVVVPLVQELTELIQAKAARCQVAAQWLRAVLAIHASQILASPGATECFAPVLGLIETRLGMLTPLSKLRGRLDLLMEQLTSSQEKSSQPTIDSLLVYQDSYSSDEDSFAEDKSESDENWDDLSEEESEMHDGELDGEMSVE